MTDAKMMKKPSLFSIAAVVLLAMMAVLAGGAALRESVTVDEVAHIGAAVSYWQKLDLRLNPEHPPLAKLWAALPLVIRGTHADYSSPQWAVSEQPFPAFLGEWVFGDWLLHRWNDPVRTLAWARLPMLFLSLVLGWVVYRCGFRLGGRWGGLLSLAVYVSTPTFLAFGPLVHTDVPIALLWLLTIWSFADIYREPSRKREWIFALCLAGALLTKFTGCILLLVFFVFHLITRWLPMADQPAEKGEAKAWRRVRRKAIWRGIWRASAVVYGVYLIFSWNQPTWVLNHIRGGAAMVPIRRLLMPIFEYFFGLFFVVITGSRPTFLLGEWHSHGIWYYFPVVLVIKSPLGFLVLLLVAVAVWLIARKRISGVIPAAQATHWRAVWVSLAVLSAICFLSRMSISIRHFSIPLMLLILLLSVLPGSLAKLPISAPAVRGLQGVTAIAALSCIVAAVLAYPYYFPFKNVLTHGRPAHVLVSDSNVDWDQSLPEVKKFAEKRGLHDLAVDSFGLTDPAESIPGARLWDCQTPKPSDQGQLVVVSANMILDSHNCPWLMGLPREEIAGGSLYAIQLPAVIPPAGSAGGPPPLGQYRQFGGMPFQFDYRVMFLQISRNPERIPSAIAEMQKQFQQQRPPTGHR